eukprot:Hpha_TRINITY_DN23969_c0_g1::TRINITY_DN23969_c0_g1_i1::g.137736::m.137736
MVSAEDTPLVGEAYAVSRRPRLRLAAAVVALLVLAPAVAGLGTEPVFTADVVRARSVSSSPLVTIAGVGAVRGSRSNGVESFLGIPYAVPPLGKRRWQPPGPPPLWEGVRNATEFGSTCVGSLCTCDPTHNPPKCTWKGESEDCLFLNVYRPAGGEEARR